MASSHLTFEPVGTVLLGAVGRVDVSGPNGRVTLLLLNADSGVSADDWKTDAAWFITHPAVSRQPWSRTRADLRPLTEESFQQLFMDLFGILYG